MPLVDPDVIDYELLRQDTVVDLAAPAAAQGQVQQQVMRLPKGAKRCRANLEIHTPPLPSPAPADTLFGYDLETTALFRGGHCRLDDPLPRRNHCEDSVLI
jgi:hypothetical protein